VKEALQFFKRGDVLRAQQQHDRGLLGLGILEDFVLQLLWIGD